MPNLAKLAYLKVVEKSGELNLVRRKKERRRYIFWFENGQFQTVIKSKLFRILTCGKWEHIGRGAKSSNNKVYGNTLGEVQRVEIIRFHEFR